MTKIRTAAMVAATLMLATGITAADIVSAPAAQAAEKGKTVRPQVGKPLLDAQNLAKAGKNDEALAKAEEANKVANKTPYETLLVNQILTSIYARKGDMANAIKSLEAAQASGEMSPQDSNNAIKQIAASYYQLKNYPKAIEFGAKYLKEVDANDTDMIVMVAQANYLQKNYKATTDGIDSAVRVAKSTNKPVKEDWLQLLMSAYHEQGNEAGTQAALEQLIVLDPKEEYWKNLIAYNQRALGSSSTATVLNLDFVKLQVGLMTTSDYMETAQLALQEGLPGAAKAVMDKGMKSGALGNDAQKDREQRLANMANTQADSDQKGLANGEAEARKAKTGDALVKFGEAYWSYGQYDKAVDAIQAGIAKGVQNPDDAKMWLGIVQLSAGKRQDAAATFKSITPGSASAQLSKLWMLANTSPPKKA